MKNYELLYIVSAQLTENELKEVQTEIDSLIKKYGGQIGFEDVLGKKKLAYPINKVIHGYYIAVEFEMEEGKNLAEIKNSLRLNKKVVRSQIINKSKITEKEIEKKSAKKEMAQTSPIQPEIEPIAEAKKAEKSSADKISREKLDEKLDEILESDNII